MCLYWFSVVGHGTFILDRVIILLCIEQNLIHHISYINFNSYANEELSKLGFDVVTMDGDVDRSTARAIVDGRCGLQGNYDPRELIEENEKTPETVRATAKALLEDLGPQRLIANLGEGLGGKESPELVKVFIDTIHSESEAMIKEAAN